MHAGAAAVFAAADDTLAERVTAVEAAIHANGQADGAAALFGHGGNSYVFISEGTTGADDSGDTLIELTGFDSTGKTLEVNADDFFIY